MINLENIEELDFINFPYEVVKHFCIYTVPGAKLESCWFCFKEKSERYKSCYNKVDPWKLLEELCILGRDN